MTASSECLFWARKTGSINRYQTITKGVSSGILLPNLELVVVTNFPRLLQ